eukprot:GHVU01220496.1.p2 GENE.GHVU01220496.1~~GHVU01220496.1.p2  ORF type:complete len:113 (+),score=9.04 GHVU01220496.1:825-1163(+)
MESLSSTEIDTETHHRECLDIDFQPKASMTSPVYVGKKLTVRQKHERENIVLLLRELIVRLTSGDGLEILDKKYLDFYTDIPDLDRIAVADAPGTTAVHLLQCDDKFSFRDE